VATRVQMPLLGLTMTEGSVTRWLRREGDQVHKGDPLMEVETDKALVQVEAPEDGFLLKILARENSTVQVGATVAILGAAHEDVSGFLQEIPQNPAPEAGKECVVSAERSQPSAAKSISPRARRLAEEHHIDWRGLSGSGADGQITEKEIRLRIAEFNKAETVQPLSRLRQIIAERLTKSQQERAHIFLTGTVDMTEARAIRDSLSGIQAPRESGAEITYNDLFIKALGSCLTEYPWVNSSLVSEGVQMHSSANVGVAVAIEDQGLVVPVIQDVQELTVAQIAEIRQKLVRKAKERRLAPDEMAGGTFTLSNLGMYGVEQFTAVINPPETGILAVGAITEEPRAIRGQVAIRPVMRVTLGVDHRVVDGALAAQFLQRFKTLVEQPRQLISTEK
jgi:pyruvate dehydrogenase E2 component (dihydrolipoamide acetyltransferase)